MRRTKLRCAARLALTALIGAAGNALPANVGNLTGLPTYPHLNSAAMDDVLKTEALGHWCARFTGTTSDSLGAVEDWYRKSLAHASETDLLHDEQFRIYPRLSGIKLAQGLDYVALYRIPNQPTVIELHRCSWSS